MSEFLNRREFLHASGLVTASAVAAGLVIPSVARAGSFSSSGRLKVGVIGCGGRGTGAAVNILEASGDVEIFAIGDMFKDRTDGARNEFKNLDKAMADRVNLSDDRVFNGFDAYQKVLASGIDIVILATPPGFRPTHFAAAVEAGKHVFMEKPVATDPAGIRTVIAAAKRAAEKKLSVVTGTQRRHEACYLEAMERIRGGAIGKVLSTSVYWNQGSLWNHAQRPEWSDMEWQLRNWLYFTWLSGDHIVEQHVHNIDVAAWAMGEVPKGCWAMGGRQVRIKPEFGHIFDHFAVEFEYADGRRVNSYCRQIDGTTPRVEEIVQGTNGRALLSSGRAEIVGEKAWKWSGKQTNPYVQEHIDLMASITGKGTYLNEAQRVAESTLMAIMGRMAAYTGKAIDWEKAMNSKLDLTPPKLELGSLPVPEVAVPGKTPLI
ncbi:MAG: Gfo/Idh/MocA family oxidoreductase [Planctomycetota bacterium]|nr:Gfo/Idh/MocA family oxidoreductase [Planctomycetota bacterium]